MIFTFAQIMAWLVHYKYLILFPVAIVEGPIVMIMSGFLLKLGYFSFLPVYLTLMAGDLIADSAWYGIGYHYARPFVKKYGHFFGLNKKLLSRTEATFKKHQSKIIFISKLTMGFGFALAVLITAGIMRVPFKKYLAFNFMGQFIWTGILISIGYFFGKLYLVIDEGLRAMSIIAFVIMIFLALFGINRYLRKKELQGRL